MRKFIGLSICAFLAFGCGDDDGATDAGFDAPMFDLGSDTNTGDPDTGTADSGPRTDSGPASTCSTYDEACTAERGCFDNTYTCVAERASSTGGVADPIMNAPAGMETYATSIFTDGMCTPQGIEETGSATACDPDDEDDTTCGDCGGCTDLGGVTMCLRSCTPSVENNSECRDTHFCSLSDELCFPFGCSTDIECRVTREDNNGIPGIQSPSDCAERAGALCGGDTTNFDALVYDTASTAVCNPDTFLCEGEPSNAAASGGDMCAGASDCEAGGRCIEESRSCVSNTDIDCTTDAHCTAAITGAAADSTCGEPSWVGGGCIKLGCEVAGNECANDGICQERGLGVALCLDGCTMGMGASADMMSTWTDPATAAGGCRTGYNCFWNGVGAYGIANNGVCLPDGFNDVAEENIGAECSDESDCWSPLGRARCIRWAEADEFGYCSVSDCLSPDFAPPAEGEEPVTVCAENSCINFGGTENPFGLCLENCTVPSDCSSAGNIGCVAITSGDDKFCFPGCTMTEDCQEGRVCEGATATDTGECVPM